MKKAISSTKGAVVYFVVLFTYIFIAISAIAFLIFAKFANNTQMLTISTAIAVSMFFCILILLFGNREICWCWVENEVLKRKWLLLGKTDSICAEEIDHVGISRDNKKIYVILKPTNHRMHGSRCFKIQNNDLNMKLVKSFWNGEIYSHELCDNCKGVEMIGEFKNQTEYLKKLAYIKELLASGNYEMCESEHPIDAVQDENGCWVDDIIVHMARCKKCGAFIFCYCDTYHGKGNLTIGK